MKPKIKKLPLIEVYRYLIDRKLSDFPFISLQMASADLDIPDYLIMAALGHLRKLKLIVFYADFFDPDTLIFTEFKGFDIPAESEENK